MLNGYTHTGSVKTGSSASGHELVAHLPAHVVKHTQHIAGPTYCRPSWPTWSGMPSGSPVCIPEAYFDVSTTLTSDAYWPSVGLPKGGASLVVNTAATIVRVARAMELVYRITARVKPDTDFTLSPWLSASAVLIASQTFAAFTSAGLTWASLNMLYSSHARVPAAVEDVISVVTNGSPRIHRWSVGRR